MEKRIEVRLSGSGGQGILLAGIILAEAALLDGKNAVQTQSYGPEARGGASRSELIISEAAIDYPKVSRPSVLLALTKEAYDKYRHDLEPDALLITDDAFAVDELPAGLRHIQAPITRSAVEHLQRSIVANIVALGVLVKASGLITEESLEAAVLNRVPKGTEELNRQALSLGFQLAADAVN